jgi:hypothetical protein
MPALAWAQHDHGIPQKTISVKDEKGRAAKVAVRPGDTVENARLYAMPIGKGAAANGAAYLRPDVTGEYRILNACINNDDSAQPKLLVAGQLYRISQHKGPLVWVKPDGKRGTVPAANLHEVKSEQVSRRARSLKTKCQP